MFLTRFNKEKRVLDLIVEGFPLTHRPFAAIAEQLGIQEQACLELVLRLSSTGQIGGIQAAFDLRGFGYQSCIAAMKIETDKLEQAVKAVHDYPGLAYCAQRYDPFNLWLSVYVSPTEGLQQTIEALHHLADSQETLMLPAMRLFKVPKVGGSGKHERILGLPPNVEPEVSPIAVNEALGEQDIRIIRALQQPLPLIEMPYKVLSQQAGVSEETLFAWVHQQEKAGLVRSVLAAPSPLKRMRGLLVGWQIPEDEVDTLCAEMVRFREVAYCDQRPVYPMWPYSVFTLLHGASEQKCIQALARIESRIGAYTHKNLFTVAEYKDTPVRFFDPALDAWWQAHSPIHDS